MICVYCLSFAPALLYLQAATSRRRRVRPSRHAVLLRDDRAGCPTCSSGCGAASTAGTSSPRRSTPSPPGKACSPARRARRVLGTLLALGRAVHHWWQTAAMSLLDRRRWPPPDRSRCRPSNATAASSSTRQLRRRPRRRAQPHRLDLLRRAGVLPRDAVLLRRGRVTKAMGLPWTRRSSAAVDAERVRRLSRRASSTTLTADTSHAAAARVAAFTLRRTAAFDSIAAERTCRASARPRRRRARRRSAARRHGRRWRLRRRLAHRGDGTRAAARCRGRRWRHRRRSQQRRVAAAGVNRRPARLDPIHPRVLQREQVLVLVVLVDRPRPVARPPCRRPGTSRTPACRAGR